MVCVMAFDKRFEMIIWALSDLLGITLAGRCTALRCSWMAGTQVENIKHPILNTEEKKVLQIYLYIRSHLIWQNSAGAFP